MIKTSYASRALSHWDALPYEIQQQVLNNTDFLTRFVSNMLTPIEKYRNEIWKDVARMDWSGNLKILPANGLPTIDNGLDLVTSRSMYKDFVILSLN
ncbi:hypothetical protein HDU76_011725, partial [Blyttiomyces sp. JEL0837]